MTLAVVVPRQIVAPAIQHKQNQKKAHINIWPLIKIHIKSIYIYKYVQDV